MTGSLQHLACKAVIILLLAVATREELNIALGRPAYQNSNWQSFSHAGLAVDGDRNGDFEANSCTATHGSKTRNQWWAVDLARETAVLKVTISNRIECCPERLHDFTVGLTNTLPTPTTSPDQSIHRVCVVYSGAFPPGARTLKCTKVVSGRYLFVQINSDGVNWELLTLCEVEVYPVPVTAIATGFREFGDCDVFTDHDTNSCAEVTSSDTPVDFVLKANISLSENSNGVRITLRNGDCDDSKQVHVYTEEKPLHSGPFDGYFKRCHVTATERPLDGSTICSFTCDCTMRRCQEVTLRIFGRFGPVRSLCEVEVIVNYDE